MTRFMLIDRGEELSEANSHLLTSASSPLRLRLLEPAPHFGQWQIVHVRPGGAGGGRSGALLLCRDGGSFCLRRRGSELGEILGRVVAIERGPLTFSLGRGPLAHLPASWLPRALDALELLGRLRHPFSPRLYLGGAEACLGGVREKYNDPGDVRQYASLALAGIDASEREIVERHVKPGGRLLDIGCGAGREALGFARIGFRVVGIDIAPAMIEAARANADREGLAMTFRAQSATELDDPPGTFDGVFWAGSYNHIPGRALRVLTLGRIARALTPDGVLILMLGYRGPRGLVSRSRLVDLLRRAGARILGTWRLSEAGDRYMLEVSAASDPREPCFFHDFSGPGEVRAELESAGLSAEEVSRGWWVCRPAILRPRLPVNVPD